MGFLSKLFGGGKKDTSSKPIAKVTGIKIIENTNYTPNIPEYQGDYAKTIFLNAYAKSSHFKSKNEYQGYLLYECGIKDAAKYRVSMIDEGYLAESSLENMVASLKTTELKEWLTELNLSTTGKKEVLVNRILESADEKSIKTKIGVVTYAITEKGEAFLKEHSAYITIHKHKEWGISWQEYDARCKPGYRGNDVIWGVFNERVINHGLKCRNDYLFMYQLLVEEGRRKDALQMLLRVIYMDVSAIEAMDSFDLYKRGLITAKEMRERFGAVIILAPRLIKDITSFADIYDDSFVDRVYEWDLPIQICNKKQFLSFVHSVFDGSYVEEEFEQKLKNAYYKVIRDMGSN